MFRAIISWFRSLFAPPGFVSWGQVDIALGDVDVTFGELG